MDLKSFLNNGDPSALEDLFKNQKNESISSKNEISKNLRKEISVSDLISAYRQRGHLFAKTNPVRPRRIHEMAINLKDFDLSENDMESFFHSGEIIGIGKSTLKEIFNALEKTYCGSIGIEYKYIRNPEILNWLEEKMETCKNSNS